MCADGSCSRRTVEVDGTFEDGTTAFGSSTTAHVVAPDQPRLIPFCTFTDSLKVGADGNVSFSALLFGIQSGLLDHASTHASGNAAPGASPFPGEPATQLQGPDFLGPQPLSQSTSRLNSRDPLTTAEFRASGFVLGFAPFPFENQVVIDNLQTLGDGDFVEIPIVALAPGEFGGGPPIGAGFGVVTEFDAGTDTVVIRDLAQPDPPFFQGTLPQLEQFAAGDQRLQVLPGTCRRVTKVGLTEEQFILLHQLLSDPMLGKNDRAEFFNMRVRVLDGSTLEETDWTASTTGPAIETRSPTGTSPVPIEVVPLDLVSIPPVVAPKRSRQPRVTDHVNWVSATSPDSMNSFTVPITVRYVDQAGKPKLGKDFVREFRKTLLGETSDGAFVLRNRGKGPVSFKLPATLPAPFAFGDGVPDDDFITLGPKRELLIPITYAPVGVDGKRKGKDKAVVFVERSDRDKPLRLQLLGTWKRPVAIE